MDSTVWLNYYVDHGSGTTTRFMLQVVEDVDTSSHGIDTITAITVAIEDKI